MGQYYKAALLAENKTTILKSFLSWTYDNGSKLMEHSYIGNNFVGAVESALLNKPQRIVWAGDYADNCKRKKTNIYDRCTENTDVSTKEVSPQSVKAPYVVNHSKKEFVDKRKSLKDKNNFNLRIHPLPLMTCEGCGRDGGDFHGEDKNNIVGSWARDLISIESRKPKGFKELIFDLVE